MEPRKAVDTGRLQNIRVCWLAFVIYWVRPSLLSSVSVLPLALWPARREWQKAITSKTNAISSKPARSSAAPISAIIDHGAQTHPPVLFTLIFALGATLTTATISAVAPTFVSERSPKEVFQITVACVPSFFLLSGGVVPPPCILFLVPPSSDSRRSYSIHAYLNAKLAGSKAVRVWQIPFGFQPVMLLGLFTVKL
ncbi:hypothetical protein B0H13DRAFT_2273947 [Mycena leptocephala]|nr:hypothetical protein B0H13DRAFT_2273947 [Mycena leptocephala]